MEKENMTTNELCDITQFCEKNSKKQVNKALIKLWKQGHLNKENKDDKQYYETAYENIRELNEICNHFGLRVVIMEQYNNIYIEPTLEEENDDFRIIDRKKHTKGLSIILYLLANRIWLDKSSSSEALIDKKELAETFEELMKIDGDLTAPEKTFESAINYCKTSGFIKSAADDEDLYIIQPYIKCKITNEELSVYKQELRKELGLSTKKEEPVNDEQ